jgi:hypothetical protein
MSAAIARVGALIAVLLATAPARAQSSSDVKVDNFGTCPAEAVLTSFPGVLRASVGIGQTLTKLPGATLERNRQGGESTGVVLAFNAQVTAFGFSSDARKLFVRTIPAEGNITSCGWVSADKLLLPRENQFKDRYKKPQPLQMRDISGAQKATENHLNVKAVVHDLSIAGDASTGIDIFEDPASGRSTGKIRLFDAFLVFAELNLPSNDPRQETRYWLIGEQSSNGSTTLKGWIRQRDVVIWPSRLAVQWNEEATVAGYSTPDNLARKSAPMTMPERIERADYPEQISRRLPVLEQAPSPEAVFNELSPGGSIESRKAVAQRMINYYKIATPGNACRKDNPQDCLSARQMDLKRAQVVDVENAVLRLDILILIDATESMDPYFASTVRTIESLIKQTEDDRIRKEYDLRFAIGLYGDYQTSEADFSKVDYREIVPFFHPKPPLGTSGAMQILLNDPKSLVYKDVHRDKLEAPYAGIIRAVKTAKWRQQKEAPLRFVVHIGDAGNRDPGRTAAETQRSRYPNAPENAGSPPQSTIREQYGETDVANVLREAGVIYIPLVIENGSSDQPAPTMWNNIFRDQADKIIQVLGIDAPIKKTQVAHSIQKKGEIEELVGRAVLTVLKSVKDGLNYRKCGSDSKSDACIKLRQEPEIAKPEFVHLVNRVASVSTGLKPEEIDNIYSRDQSIVTMYSPARSIEGKEMFTHWVALDRGEFKVLRDLLRNLCDNMSKQDSKNPVMTALRVFTETYSDEDFTDLSVREILGKRLGIPNLERTDFSGRTREEIDDAYRAWQSGDRETWDNWHLRACKANTFTQLMEDDRKVDPAAIQCDMTSHSCQAPEAAQKKFRWSVQVSLDAPTFYVPLDILP